ncbi:MAG: 30S ribosomal protein S1 [Deltaproteobacteria bacterium]|nr:30S ribosomal protein S1 [Deltaproteobacteria bacterium]
MDTENQTTNESQELNETEETKSFAELLAETEVTKDWLKPGQKVEVMIVKITPEWIFLDLGGKTEGYLDRRELSDEDGNVSVKEGDKIRAYFLSSRNNEKLFTTKVGGGEAGRTFLEDAWQSGIPIEGIVEKETKGGYEVKISGDIRSFCPYSQMGLKREEKPGDYLGKRLPFNIIEYGERGKNIILSRKDILKEEQEQQKEAVKQTIQEGMTVKGKIVNIQKFGAFMDIGGVQGLIPISEIGWSRVGDINDHLSVGQEVEAVIMKLDWEKDRISMSLKQTIADPWDQVDNKYLVGSIHTGRVLSMTKFGAFIALEPGIDGLLHISKLKGDKKTKGGAAPSLVVDQTLDVQIEAIDRSAKRISLAMATASGPDEEKKEDRDDYRDYMGKPANSLGSLHDLLKDKFPVKGKGEKR